MENTISKKKDTIISSISIIESPFQLISAIEANFKFNCKKTTLLLKKTKNKANNSQLEEILKISNFQKIIIIPYLGSLFVSNILTMFYVKFFVFKKFNYVFIGEPRNVVSLSAIHNIKHEFNFFLDDGNETINIQNYFLSHNSLKNYYPNQKKYFLVLKIFMFFFGLKRKEVRHINWFTCFEFKKLEGQLIVQNKFNYFKINNTLSGDCLQKNFFIGGPLSELKIISENLELALIKKYLKICIENQKELIYCVHRRESSEKLNKIKLLVGESNLRFCTYPLEIDLIMSRIKVNHISSFISSALCTLHVIFDPSSIDLISITPFIKEKKTLEELSCIEEHYRKSIKKLEFLKLSV